MNRSPSLVRSFPVALLRHGLACVLAMAMLLTAATVLGADHRAAATANHAWQAMVPPPEGRAPDKSPELAAMGEAGLETRRSPLPRTSGHSPGCEIGYELPPPLSHVFQLAAADATRRQALTRAHDYPRDPHLRLNHGHAPPAG